MTPRHVRGGKSNTNEFARQLAEHRREGEQQPPAKRFKASAAPKGTKFASGYQDRTALRRQEDGEAAEGKESVEQRLKALEDMVKLGQIDQATFDKLRKEIGVGGDIDSTHLVKGLDWDLLRRAKAGEDLAQKPEEEEVEKKEGKDIDPVDVDDELDRVLDEKEGFIAPAPKEKKIKKGNLAMPPPSGKLSRDEILKQLKASRAAAATPTQPPPPESTLSTKFKKIDKSGKKRWIETDPSTGRRKEILVITDAEGNTKRKTRWLDKEPPRNQPAATPKVDDNGLLLPGQDAKPLGMEVPAVIAARIAAEKKAEEEEDDDIFAGVGTDYNPLGDLDEDEDSDDEEKDEGKGVREDALAIKAEQTVPAITEPSTQQPPPRRNYFKKTDEEIAIDEPRTNPLTSDPTLIAALKRAAALRQSSRTEEGDDSHAIDMEESEFAEEEDPERLARRKQFLEEARRRDALDALDLDYGFGSSRIEDEEDDEGPTFGDGEHQRGGNKRKRGPKKRKGDKDSATDVLRVMEGRKKS